MTCPTSGPVPLMRVEHPGWNFSLVAMIWASRSPLSGAISLGCGTFMVHPAASAGATFTNNLVRRPVPRCDQAADAYRFLHDPGRHAALFAPETKLLQQRCVVVASMWAQAGKGLGIAREADRRAHFL